MVEYEYPWSPISGIPPKKTFISSCFLRKGIDCIRKQMRMRAKSKPNFCLWQDKDLACLHLKVSEIIEYEFDLPNALLAPHDSCSVLLRYKSNDFSLIEFEIGILEKLSIPYVNHSDFPIFDLFESAGTYKNFLESVRGVS